MGDVVLRWTQLLELVENLQLIRDELESADSNADTLQGALGAPFNRAGLGESVKDFEDRWKYKRTMLAKDLETLHEHTKAVKEGFENFDIEAAQQFEAGADY